MDLEKPEVEYNCYCAMCSNDPEAEMDLEKPEVEYNCYCAMCSNDPEAASEDEGEDETPTTSNEDFIVSDSEMEEVSQEDAAEDQMDLLFISLIRMRSKRDIKMGRLCTPGGAVLGIVGGGVTFRFLNGEAILDENMLFWVRLYALVVVLKILLDFRL